ncbi:hypothetical protein JZ751_000730 [Albula glossodonta]|uniref:Uncharacterized protein n=1 Tax=Albula glossodonta TaxID=121402 RepID=A0A8T2PXE2_9TELE|nr:hypothetical protein JZ751_000730 [Albula glossodonta]
MGEINGGLLIGPSFTGNNGRARKFQSLCYRACFVVCVCSPLLCSLSSFSVASPLGRPPLCGGHERPSHTKLAQSSALQPQGFTLTATSMRELPAAPGSCPAGTVATAFPCPATPPAPGLPSRHA